MYDTTTFCRSQFLIIEEKKVLRYDLLSQEIVNRFTFVQTSMFYNSKRVILGGNLLRIFFVYIQRGLFIWTDVNNSETADFLKKCCRQKVALFQKKK